MYLARFSRTAPIKALDLARHTEPELIWGVYLASVIGWVVVVAGRPIRGEDLVTWFRVATQFSFIEWPIGRAQTQRRQPPCRNTPSPIVARVFFVAVVVFVVLSRCYCSWGRKDWIWVWWIWTHAKRHPCCRRSASWRETNRRQMAAPATAPHPHRLILLHLSISFIFFFFFFFPSNRIFQLLIAQIRPFGLFSSAIDWNLWTFFFNLPLPLHLMYNSWCYWLFRWIMLILISTQSSQLIWITNSIALSWLTELTLCLLTGKRTFFFSRKFIQTLNQNIE